MKITKVKQIKYKYKVVNRLNESVFAKGIYKKLYSKGYVVSAKDTFGIMVFNTRRLAEEWSSSRRHGGWKIKRVIPIGRGKKITRVYFDQDGIPLKRFYDNFEEFMDNSSHHTIPAPEGTMGYPSVKVVD